MPGPFPGMDPYLENPYHWGDFHQRFITYLADEIGPRVRPAFQTLIGEHIYVIDPPSRQTYIPDVTIVRRAPAVLAPAAVLEAPAAEQPMVYERFGDPIRQGYIQLISRKSGEVVTVIELLSPTNKVVGDGRVEYLKKQQDVLRSTASLVEIDLWSRGTPVTDIAPLDTLQLPDHRYLVAVYRSSQRQRVEVYGASLSRPLPVISIPLDDRHADVTVALQPIVDRCYDNGGYAYLYDYRVPPEAPLNAEESFWVDAVLREKGLRDSDVARRE